MSSGPRDDANFRSTLDRLLRWVAVSSPSGDPAGLAKMARRLVDDAAGIGLTARIREAADARGIGHPVVEIESPQADRHGSRSLLLVGHFDTVLAAAPPVLDDERLVATGAIDMKGGIAAFFGAVASLAERGRPLPAFRLILTPDEELGGEISRREMECQGAAAELLWVLEPGESTPDGETIVVGRRGLVQWRLQARGRAAHSGVEFWSGRSATAGVAEWIAGAERRMRSGGGPTINFSRVVGGTAEFVDRLEENAALLGTQREINVVPARATVEGELRFVRAAEGPDLVAGLAALAEEIAARREIDLEFVVEGRIAPVDAAAASPEWSRRAVVSAATAGWNLTLETERGGISFPNFLPPSTTIPVLDGLGPVGGGMHTRDEYLELRSLRRRIALLAELLEAAAESGG
ncbi:MAG: M20/M25/M40 family metallo-hydrolase [Thermoanaerobaculia bacterium]